jgi:hypothetical protein
LNWFLKLFSTKEIKSRMKHVDVTMYNFFKHSKTRHEIKFPLGLSQWGWWIAVGHAVGQKCGVTPRSNAFHWLPCILSRRNRTRILTLPDSAVLYVPVSTMQLKIHLHNHTQSYELFHCRCLIGLLKQTNKKQYDFSLL